MYKLSEINNDTIPTYKIDNSPEGNKESFLKKNNLTINEIYSVMKRLTLY